MQIQIMTDSGADIPNSLMERYDMKVVPLNVHFGDEQYRSGIDIDLPTFHEKMNASEELPTTSAPAPYDFYQTFKAVDADKPIVMLSLSQELSTTHDNAVMGKDMLLEEEPNRKIVVLNTKSATSGMTLLADEAGKRAEEGMEFDAFIQHMEERIEQTATLIYLRTVENLIKGGRLDRFKGTIAKTLNIKVLMKKSDIGTIEVAEKVRGNKKALRRFLEQIGEYTKTFENKTIAVSYSTTEEKAKQFLSEVKERYAFKDSILTEMGPLIATHAGEGGYVISFFRD